MIDILKSPSGKLLVFGIAQEIIFVGLLALGNLREEIPSFLLFYCGAFIVYLGAVRSGYHKPDHPTEHREHILLILGFSLLFRATLIFSDPSLSDDIYRYIWDGKLVVEGINPYQHVPGASELIGLRDWHFDKVNHKDIGTPYGPLSIMIFAAAQAISDSVLFMKVPFVLFDCLSILLIIRILKLGGASPNNVIVYAWNPLVLIEIAGSGHNDSLGICMLLFALYQLQRKWYNAASSGVAMAVLSKYFSLLSLPVILKRLSAKHCLMVILIILLGYLPFAGHIETHLLNILKVGSLWQFNDSIFSLLLVLTHSPLIARILVCIAMVILAIVVWRSHLPPAKALMILIGSALLLTTTVQPWYLLWIVPFLCIYLNRAWLLLTGLVMLSYQVLTGYDATGVWLESLWVKLVIYVPFYLLLVGDALKSRWDRLARPAAEE